MNEQQQAQEPQEKITHFALRCENEYERGVLVGVLASLGYTYWNNGRSFLEGSFWAGYPCVFLADEGNVGNFATLGFHNRKEILAMEWIKATEAAQAKRIAELEAENQQLRVLRTDVVRALAHLDDGINHGPPVDLAFDILKKALTTPPSCLHTT